jgi:dethiobiotin synthetase
MSSKIGQTLFVTGTDTDAGKTVVATALLRALGAAGCRACGFKPVASGAVQTPDGLRSDDALQLLAAGSTGVAYDDLNPQVFAPPIAPHWAARQAGVVIDPATLLAAHARLAMAHDVVVAEGAGGWLTPLADDLTLGDWVAGQGWPVLLVVRLRLGCINHALLTVESIRQRRSPWLGWVANAVPADGPHEPGGALSTLTTRLGPPLWVQDGFSPPPARALQTLLQRARAAAGR